MKKVFKILMCFFVSFSVSCASRSGWYPTTPVKQTKPYVVVDRTDAIHGRTLALCIAPFKSKEWPLNWRTQISEMYENSLVRKKLFSRVRKISWNGENLKDLLYKAKKANCDLVLYGVLRKALVSGGYQTQGLKVEVWIFDSTTDWEPLYHVEQMAYSVPGSSKDWFWKTSTGTRAASIDRIVALLASQFADELEKSVNMHKKQRDKKEEK